MRTLQLNYSSEASTSIARRETRAEAQLREQLYEVLSVGTPACALAISKLYVQNITPVSKGPPRFCNRHIGIADAPMSLRSRHASSAKSEPTLNQTACPHPSVLDHLSTPCLVAAPEEAFIYQTSNLSALAHAWPD